VLFYVADRYRILLMPMLWPLAARGMLALGDRLRLGWRAAAGSLALLAGASLLAQLPLMSEAQQKNSIASSYNLQGKIEGDVGHLDRAERYFRLAIAHSAPGTGSLARSNLGRLYELRGDEKEAERWYREAVEINPESRQALQRLAALSERRGDIGAALRWWERLAEVFADDSTAQKNIARLRALSPEAPPP
jgi:tetratricopeptide (TPR) repeat protein